MLSAKKVLAASMDYTDESVAGAGAIKGAPCEIKSITPITGGNTVTFKWLDSNNVEHTSTMDVMDGQDGEDGKGIASVTINAEEHLIITYTDGSTSDAGEIEVQSAVDSVNGQTGEVVLTASDVNALPDDTTLADLSGDSTHRTVTDAEKTAWNAKSDFSGSYDDLTDKPSIPDEISDLDDTAISSPKNGQVMTYDSGKWKNADNNPTITVDSALSTTSENPVQNKVLTTEINKKAEYEEISWEDYQALSYEEKHNGKQYFVTGAPGSAVSASGVSYDNTTSGMTADNVQDALDEIAAGGGQIDSAMSTTSTNPLQNKVITLEVQDMRASMLNDELKLSAVELAVSQLQTSALNTELRLSTAELAVSQLQTSMLNMDGAVDDIEDEIADIVNVYSAKNLIPYPFWSNNQASPLYGVSYTINADGSITFSGTSTQVIWFGLCGRINYEYPLSLKAGNYIISCAGLPSEVSSYVGIFEEGNTAPLARATYTDPEGLLGLETDKDVFVGFRIPADFAIDTTIKPMLRMASVKDDTYVPYAMTNKQLTDEKLEEVMYEEEIHGVNLLKGTIESGELSNGVTITVSDNTVFTLNGTPTANGEKTLMTIREGGILKDGETYVISDGGSSSYYGAYIYLNGLKKSDSSTDYDIVRLQDKSTFTADFTTYSRYTLGIYVRTDAGTLSNKKFYLMLRKADIEDSTYRPYNEQAIQNQLDAQGVLGAKNILPNNANSGSNRGITYTVNSNKSVTANGTATGGNSSYTIYEGILPTGKYLFSGGVSEDFRFGLRKTSESSWIGDSRNEDPVPITIEANVSYSVFVWVKDAVTANNVVFKPMIRLASDPDNTYQPYAMTNKELTDRVIQSVVSVNRDTTTTNSGTIKLYRYGNLRILTGNFNPSVAGTSATNSHIADLPLATDNPTYNIISVCGRGETDSSATAKIGNLNIGTDGVIKYQGQATGENMFFNIVWVVG